MSTSCIKCGDEVATKRSLLGYRTCLPCGDVEARKRTFVSAPINKSNYMLITDVAQLRQLNPKRTEGI